MEFKHIKSENPVWSFYDQEMVRGQNVKPVKKPRDSEVKVTLRSF